MRAIPYKQAIEWMLLNDDTDFLDDENGSLSVTGYFLSDIYRVPSDQVVDDLRKMRKKFRKERGQ